MSGQAQRTEVAFGNSLQRQGIEEDELQTKRADAPSPSSLGVQAKLTVGPADDPYEREADSVAAQVVREINAPQAPMADADVQRQGVEEDELQTKPLPDAMQRDVEPDGNIQAKPAIQRKPADGGMDASPDVEDSIRTARGGGQPMAENVRGPMESAFGADFSGVRVHTDSRSDSLNQSIQARAFTTGQDVFFRGGEYSPGSSGGQELLAHELTHVVQQNGSAVQSKKENE